MGPRPFRVPIYQKHEDTPYWFRSYKDIYKDPSLDVSKVCANHMSNKEKNFTNHRPTDSHTQLILRSFPARQYQPSLHNL